MLTKFVFVGKFRNCLCKIYLGALWPADSSARPPRPQETADLCLPLRASVSSHAQKVAPSESTRRKEQSCENSRFYLTDRFEWNINTLLQLVKRWFGKRGDRTVSFSTVSLSKAAAAGGSIEQQMNLTSTWGESQATRVGAEHTSVALLEMFCHSIMLQMHRNPQNWFS